MKLTKTLKQKLEARLLEMIKLAPVYKVSWKVTQRENDRWYGRWIVSDTPRIPKLIYRRAEVLGLPKMLTRGRRTSCSKYSGVAYVQAGYIFLNVKRAVSTLDLYNTLAHELVHFAYPNLGHTKVFYDYVGRLERGKPLPIAKRA